MKRFERILLKLVLIQFVCLVIVQWLLLHTQISLYMQKTVEYEGVYVAKRQEVRKQ